MRLRLEFAGAWSCRTTQTIVKILDWILRAMVGLCLFFNRSDMIKYVFRTLTLAAVQRMDLERSKTRDERNSQELSV